MSESQDGVPGLTDQVPVKTQPAKKAKKASTGRPATRAARSKRTGTTQTAKFPRHSLEKALRIPKALYEQNGGKAATRAEAVKFAGASGLNGPWNVELSSSQKYGLLEPAEAGKVALSERGRRAIAPQSETDRLAALREAILAAPDVADVYNYYRGEQLPDSGFFVNALIDRFKIPADKVGEFQQIFDESIRTAELLDESGPRPRLIDVGREEGAATPKPTGGAKVTVPAGTTCFVMQPFAAPLGSYYETIFKPAITQAGLEPLRADAEIFATGKIIDQIWRGIHGAKVLVAELTSKNPNVFYELGLAHALSKPVVLVSSNEGDVPFDLRHIRVIIYDQTDPFWGQKLIDKIADNIKSAITNPEEAIFKIDDLSH